MRSKKLPRQHIPHPVILLRHISNMISIWIHDDILVGLFEAQEDVHHLELSLDDECAVVQDGHGGVIRLEHTIWVFWYADWCDQI